MVYILDKGSEFKGPIDKVWQLLQSDASHKHSYRKNIQMVKGGDSPVMSFDELTPDGRWVRESVKMTMVPPLGFAIEFLDGDQVGTRFMQYYTPRGNKTGVTVVGEWVSKSAPPEQLKRTVMKHLETAFNEDQENLKRI